MRDDSARVIPLAKIISRQGIPQKNTYKAELYSGSAFIFKDLQEFFYRESEDSKFVKIELEDKLSPLGGKWEEAKFIQIKFPTLITVQLSAQLGLLRSAFPPLESQEGVYLCDLVGIDVYDEDGRSCGKLETFYWQGPAVCESVLMLVNTGSKKVQIPWTDQITVDLKKSKLLYPGFTLWENL
jgi:ribosomal 30S subunit maturation factor RimM